MRTILLVLLGVCVNGFTPNPDCVTTSYTLDEVANHKLLKDCWTIMDGDVYDLSGYQHPGGNRLMERYVCGQDGTKLYKTGYTHSIVIFKRGDWGALCIGKSYVPALETCPPPGGAPPCREGSLDAGSYLLVAVVLQLFLIFFVKRVMDLKKSIFHVSRSDFDKFAFSAEDIKTIANGNEAELDAAARRQRTASSGEDDLDFSSFLGMGLQTSHYMQAARMTATGPASSAVPRAFRKSQVNKNRFGTYKPRKEDPLFSTVDKPVLPKVIAASLKMKSHRHNWCTSAVRCMTQRLPGRKASYGSLSLALAFICLNILCIPINHFWYDTELNWGKGFAQLATANTALLTLMSTKNNLVTALTGRAFDKVIIYHRSIARWMFLCMILHGAYYWEQVLIGLQSTPIFNSALTGVAAGCCGIFIMATSLTCVRRSSYSCFFWMHFTFLGFFVAVYFHHPRCQRDIYICFGLWLLDRIASAFSTLVSRRTLVFRPKGDIARVRFSKNPFTFHKHKVGQYYFVNFPKLSRTEWHPFSVSSGPREESVEMHIRALGDHTTEIVKLAHQYHLSSGKLPWIRIDGPYGNSLPSGFRRYAGLCLVGGGVGITPIIGMLKDIYQVGEYSKRNNRGVEPHRTRVVYCIWIMKKVIDYDCFKFELHQCMLNSRLPQFPVLVVGVYVTKGGNNPPVPLFAGRPKLSFVFDQLQANLQGKSGSDQKMIDMQNFAGCAEHEKATALYDYANDEGTGEYKFLQFRKGDVVTILNKDGGWWLGSCNGKEGYFPPDHVQATSSADVYVEPSPKRFASMAKDNNQSVLSFCCGPRVLETQVQQECLKRDAAGGQFDFFNENFEF